MKGKIDQNLWSLRFFFLTHFAKWFYRENESVSYGFSMLFQGFSGGFCLSLTLFGRLSPSPSSHSRAAHAALAPAQAAHVAHAARPAAPSEAHAVRDASGACLFFNHGFCRFFPRQNHDFSRFST